MPRLSPDDADLWRRVTHGVAPLSGRQPHTKPVLPGLDRTIIIKGIHQAGGARAGLDAARTPAAEAQPHPPPPADFTGVDRRTAERLRRGRYPVEARLDLHGMTQDEAHRALSSFISGARAAEKRCVLVITGHGRISGGVLKAAVPRWLAEPSLRPHVLTLAAARPPHGGSGALYVLLRRAGR